MPYRSSSCSSSNALFFSDYSDEDDISLTSTVPSDPEETYTVKAILDRRDFADNVTRYLVRWEGYGTERCTWEPASSFDSPETLEDFNEMYRSGNGLVDSHQIEDVLQKIKAYEAGKEHRKRRRNAKRKRLAVKIRPSTPSPRRPKKGGRDVSISTTALDGDKTSLKVKYASEAPGSQPQGPATEFSNSARETVSTSAPRHTEDTSSISLKRSLKIFNSLTVDSDSHPPKLFHNLSTRRRYELAGRQEPAADLSKLDLRPLDRLKTRNADVSAQFTNTEELQEQSSPSNNFLVPAAKDHPDSGKEGAQAIPLSSVDINGSTPRASARGQILQTSEACPVTLAPDPRPDFQTCPDEEAEVARIGRGRTFTGRYWALGDVLISLAFGAKIIGDVRVENLGRAWWSKSLVDLKLKEKDSIFISFNEVCTVGQYGQLCDQYIGQTNEKYANAWITGYADTYIRVNDVTRYLRDSGQAALWHHPSKSVVMVLYASKSPPWSFLEQDATFPPEATLRVVARSSMPSVQSLQPASTVLMDPLTLIPPNTPPRPISTDHLSVAVAMNNVNGIPQMEDTHVPDSAAVAKDNDQQWQADTALMLESDIIAEFSRQYKITYPQLLGFPKLEPRKQPFFLLFPEEPLLEMEFRLVKAFLRKHKLAAVYSNRDQNEGLTDRWQGWERFVLTVEAGTIIFHDSFSHFHKLPNLHKALRAPNIRMFTVSLRESLPFRDHPLHLDRIFPHGKAVLLPERTIADEPDIAVQILKDFSTAVKAKHAGTWKIVLPPNIRERLLQAADQLNDARFLTMYNYVDGLDSNYPSTYALSSRQTSEPEWLHGKFDETGTAHPVVSAGHIENYVGAALISRVERLSRPSQSQSDGETPQTPCLSGDKDDSLRKDILQDEDRLIEYFAGWALLNILSHRRFLVASPEPVLKRWRRWGHIEFLNPITLAEHLLVGIEAK